MKTAFKNESVFLFIYKKWICSFFFHLNAKKNGFKIINEQTNKNIATKKQVDLKFSFDSSSIQFTPTQTFRPHNNIFIKIIKWLHRNMAYNPYQCYGDKIGVADCIGNWGFSNSIATKGNELSRIKCLMERMDQLRYQQ